MEAGRTVFVGFWRTPPAELVLLLSLLLHAGLAFWRLWQRRSLRMPPIEVLQLATGVMIPLWLTGHVLGTAVLHRLADSRDSYAYVLALAWPGGLSNLTAALVPGLAARLHRPASLAAAQALVPAPACPGARSGPAPAGPRRARRRLGRSRLRPAQGRRSALGANRSLASSAGHRRKRASGWSSVRSGGSSKASNGWSS